MTQEWNVTATTACLLRDRAVPVDSERIRKVASTMLAERDRNSTAIASVSAYIDRFLERGDSNQQIASGQQMVFPERSKQVFQKPSASGVAYPSENVVFVNNFGYSTAALSHEILHRVFEEEGHDKGCYVDMVHENQLKYELTQVGDNKCPVIKKFDC